MLSSLSVWQSLAIPWKALRYDWGLSTSHFFQIRTILCAVQTSSNEGTVRSRLLSSSPPAHFGGDNRSDRFPSSCGRTFMTEYNYRQILKIMAPQEKRLRKVSLGFCSFDSSVDHMMLLPGSSKLVNS